MKIVVKKGLDVPLEGKPEGPVRDLPKPKQIALNLDPFDKTRFKVHVKAGESVKIGQPLVESKSLPGQMFVSPAGGVVSEIRRGLKRRLLDIVIDLDPHELDFEREKLSPVASREEILDFFMRSGIFPHIRMRPFDLVADPKYEPRAIFVRAIETLPFLPSAEMQVEGNEVYFQAGLDTLKKLTRGKLHLVYKENSDCKAFSQAQGVEKHTVSGPHPAGTSSLHIHKIDPIKNANDCVWTLSAVDVLTVGKMALEGRYFTDRILGIGGNGIIEGKTGFFRARAGFPVNVLIADRLTNNLLRFITGDPLTGTKVDTHDFVGFYQTAFTVIPENTERQSFHFLRPGFDKFTATRAYFTGHIKPPEKGYPFSTNQHGEERAFIDSRVYDRVMPMRIPTVHLIKAILSEDFELAESLGLLEVTADDFALPTFICPSKIEMIQIVKDGLYAYSKEMGH
ncbi:MAG: Na(+)-translocating NADH-quinone reductase subunit A [Chlamydiales bacterium]|nr:Na(+)-translocating NADH-quinone reductase subunit A [Chlamydiales bacterium]